MSYSLLRRSPKSGVLTFGRHRLSGTVRLRVAPAFHPLVGNGYLAGEFPGGTTTVEGAPVSASVRVVYRPELGGIGDGAVVATTQSGQDGTWIVEGLDTSKLFDVIGRVDGLNDVIVAGVTPTSMVDITYSGAVVENETFTGAVGFLELVGGIPPYAVAAETPFPSGLFPVVSGHNLIIDGTTDSDEVASFDVKVTSSNGAEKIIPLQLVVGFKAPANFKAETVVVDDVFSVSLTWEVTNSTQQIRVYRSATPFDLDDLPEPIATLSGTSTTYTDDDVIEDDHFYYMVTAVCEQYELRSNVIAEDVVERDPHWDKVVALLHFDGDLVDETGFVWNQLVSPTFESGMFLQSLRGHASQATLEGGKNTIADNQSTPFTVEAFVKMRSTEIVRIVSQDRRAGSGDQSLYITPSHIRWQDLPVSSSTIAYVDTPTDTWVHVAFTYDGTTRRAFINGNAVFEVINHGWRPNQYGVRVMGSHNGSYGQSGTSGSLDELRITKGVARYTENFTPPTEPFPNS